MTDDLINQVINKLKAGWSPKQISGRFKKRGRAISHETLYQHIWKDKQKGGRLYQYLRHSDKKYNKRSGKNAGWGCIPHRVGIEERPKIFERKSCFGDPLDDGQGDTIMRAKHQGALATYVDRKSKFVVIAKLPNKEAASTTKKTIASLMPIKRRVKTITFDQGKEFSKHGTIAKQWDARCYFAKLYHAWERGLNEHTNGLIRQYFPKSTNFNEISEAHVQIVMEKINNRRR